LATYLCGPPIHTLVASAMATHATDRSARKDRPAGHPPNSCPNLLTPLRDASKSGPELHLLRYCNSCNRWSRSRFFRTECKSTGTNCQCRTSCNCRGGNPLRKTWGTNRLAATQVAVLGTSNRGNSPGACCGNRSCSVASNTHGVDTRNSNYSPMPTQPLQTKTMSCSATNSPLRMQPLQIGTMSCSAMAVMCCCP